MKKIAIFGIALNSTNYGVSALGISQIRLLETISYENLLEFEYHVFSGEKESDIEEIKQYIPYQKIVFHDIVRIKKGIRGYKEIYTIVKGCDIAIDLTYGDSFSDIYGLKNYVLYSIPKLIVILSHKGLVLGPQTYGPYNSLFAKVSANWLIKKSYIVYSRDKLSIEAISKECTSNIIVSSDLAMQLPYPKKDERNSSDTIIGLNVSNLLWAEGSKLHLSIDYRSFTRELIERLISKGYKVVLIAHTFDESDNEYRICQELQNEYPQCILAPKFRNPIEAKGYISNLNFFIGARMHATIGAFSSGVPIAPIGYSRKFRGLYENIEYPYIIDCSKIDKENGISTVLEMVSNIEYYKEKIEISIQKANSLIEKYKNGLLHILS